MTFGKDGDRTNTAALQNAIAEMRWGLADISDVIGCYSNAPWMICSAGHVPRVMFRGLHVMPVMLRGLYVPGVNVPQIEFSAK